MCFRPSVFYCDLSARFPGGKGIDNREDIFFWDLVMQQGKQAKKKKTDLRIYSTLLLTLPNESSSYPHLLQIPAIAQACKGRKEGSSFVRRFFPGAECPNTSFSLLTCSSVVIVALKLESHTHTYTPSPPPPS